MLTKYVITSIWQLLIRYKIMTVNDLAYVSTS